ncbi:MAG: hypothetical protein WEA75_01015 [Acidimicrobiia bacterium]
MTWVAPSTVTPGQVATAALWNEQVRDNMKVGRDSGRTSRTSGNITVNSTTWTNLDNNLDITLGGAAADRFRAELGIYISSEATSLYVDARTVTGSNYFTPNTAETNVGGFPGWTMGSGFQGARSGGPTYVTVSGDYAAGVCAVRLRTRTSGAVNKTVVATTDLSLLHYLYNLGPRVTA